MTGSRFALLEVKILLVHMLSRFCFRLTPKTILPLTLEKKSFPMMPEGGFELRFERREKCA